MANLRVQRRRREPGEEGASLVEFALIMPLLFTLLLGLLTGGITLSRDNSVKNAVHEGSRYGAINPIGDPPMPFVYLGQVIDVTRVGAQKDLNNGVDGKEICVALFNGGGTWRIVENAAGTRFEDTGTASSPASCFSDGRPLTENRVQVTAKRRSEIESLFFSIPVTISAQSVARYER